MSEIHWDETGDRYYEAGTKNGVLYPKKSDGTYDNGVAWNGLTAVTESPSGAEETALYADDMKYLGLRSAEEFGCTIECYTYPDEWMECDGSAELITGMSVSQQTHKGFGFSYRTLIGNDSQGDKKGYKIHVVYNGVASPSEKSFATINDSPEAVTFSYEVTTTPEKITSKDVNGNDLKPSATLTFDSTKLTDAQMKAVKDTLYGTENSEPTLPLPDAFLGILQGASGATGATGTNG